MTDKIGPDRDKVTLYLRICERAEKMGICRGQRIDALMDVESADIKFNLRLGDWLAADDANFAHDFRGIQSSIVRGEGFPATDFGLFVPRFSAPKYDLQKEAE